MIETFLSHIIDKKILTKENKVLLAVSGGVDSMVMLEIFLKCSLDIGVAHINHNLRGNESYKDQELVRIYCQENTLPFYTLTLEKDALLTGNLQQKARNLRYSFLYDLAEKNGYDFIATAHHKDDNIENMLINMMRGTGIEGLKGMDVLSEKIIRPLLFFTNEEIRQYASTNHIPFREDASNASNKYMRNKVRNELIPKMYETDPRAKIGLYTTQSNLISSFKLYQQLVDKVKTEVFFEDEGKIIINLDKIISFNECETLLFELIRPYGFNMDQVATIVANENKTGTYYLSSQFRATINRSQLWISKINTNEKNEIILSVNDCPQTITLGQKLYKFEQMPIENIIDYSNDVLYIHADNLSNNLLIRYRQPGDKIQPLGMNGQFQKLKDYLINKKVPQPLKDEIPLLVHQTEICAVLLYGISETFKLIPETKNVLVIRRIENGN